MGQKLVTAWERPFCQVGSCFLGQTPSRYRVRDTYCCHWHFAETFIREMQQPWDGQPVTLAVYTRRRPWDKAVLWLRLKWLKLAGRL